MAGRQMGTPGGRRPARPGPRSVPPALLLLPAGLSLLAGLDAARFARQRDEAAPVETRGVAAALVASIVWLRVHVPLTAMGAGR